MEILRQCKCGVIAYTTEDLELFEKSKVSNHGRANRCKRCSSKRSIEYAKANPEKERLRWRRSNAKRYYGITLEEYEDAMKTSDECEICGTKHELCYDHCHNSGDFRGVLCSRCNLAIGNLMDSSEFAYQAYLYLLDKETKTLK